MNTTEMFAMSIVPFLVFVIWLGVLMLMTRLTRTTERNAAAMHHNPPGHDRASINSQ